MAFTIKINGTDHTVEVDADTPEAYAARAIEIASQSTDPFIQERLIEMAQRWMGMAMDEEDGEGAEQLTF